MSAKTWKDRIKRFERIPPAKLKANPANFRRHSDTQRRLLRSVFEEVGVADACVVREVDDGTYEIIDGHLRSHMHGNHDKPVPCLVTDLDAEEARQILATYHPLGDMAQVEREKFSALVAQIVLRDDELTRHLRHVARLDTEKKPEEDQPEYPITPRFSESYNYVVIFVDNEVDWVCLQETLGLQRTQCRYYPKRIGIGRVLTFAEFMERWRTRLAFADPESAAAQESPAAPRSDNLAGEAERVSE